MNFATRFLADHWQELGLAQLISPERASWVVLTPRFPASKHVLFFLLPEGAHDPVLVMKVARLPGQDASVSREARNLAAIHAARDGGFRSIPRLIAFTSSTENSILCESALVGRQMSPEFVRRNAAWCVESVLQWLLDIHSATAISNSNDEDWFERLVEAPLARLQSALALSAEEERLIETVRGMAEKLKHLHFPLVFFHGDLSDPNIIVLREGGVGVVDWELAEPNSLPLSGLLFFLNFVESACTVPVAHPLVPFRKVFFSDRTWASDIVSRYIAELGIPIAAVQPLFVLCFTRYLSALVARIMISGDKLDDETAAWLRTDREYILWRESVLQVSNLKLV